MASNKKTLKKVSKTFGVIKKSRTFAMSSGVKLLPPNLFNHFIIIIIMKRFTLIAACLFLSFNAFAGNGEEGVTLVKESCIAVNGFVYTFDYVANDGNRVYFNEILRQKAVLHVVCNEVQVGGAFYTCEGAGTGYKGVKPHKKFGK
jgi:hypothetical protein